MDEGASILRLAFALFLVGLNAFFVASEFAIVKVRPTRIRELVDSGSRTARVAQRIVSRLDAYLSANQLGITIASLGLGWVGEPTMARLLEPLLHWLAPGMSALALHSISAAVGFSIITFLHVVLGELAPKTLSIQKAEVVTLICAYPLHWFYVTSFPVIWALNAAANLFLRPWGLRPASEGEAAHTEEEIKMIVSSSHEQGVLEEHERDLLENVFDYADRVAREIMTPRNEVVAIEVDAPIGEIVDFVLAESYSRYPVYQKEKDHIVGVAHIRDILEVYSQRTERRTLRHVLREPLIVPETLPVHVLRQRFQSDRTHLAIVVDEYGSLAGVVTMEDLVEEVFGDFQDEFDEESREPVIHRKDGIELDATLHFEDVLELLGVEGDFPHEGVDTIGGYVFSLLGKKPEVGDAVRIDGHTLQVLAVEGLRIARLIARPQPRERESAGTGEGAVGEGA